MVVDDVVVKVAKNGREYAIIKSGGEAYFAWNKMAQLAKNINIGDDVDVQFEKGPRGNNVTSINIANSEAVGRAKEKARTYIEGKIASKGDDSRMPMMFTSYVKDLMVAGKNQQDAIKSIFEIYDAVQKRLSGEPERVVEAPKARTKSTYIDELGEKLGFDTNGVMWREFLKERLDKVTKGDLVMELEQVVDKKKSLKVTPDGKIAIGEGV